jgi:hypothetical protein
MAGGRRSTSATAMRVDQARELAEALMNATSVS